jgi:hypothetical protein
VSPPKLTMPRQSSGGDESARRHQLQQHPRPWEDSDRCRRCDAKFTTLKRSHHCRRCGAAVCGACSPSKLALPYIGHVKPVRVCDLCAAEVRAEQEDEFLGGSPLNACFTDVLASPTSDSSYWMPLEAAKDEDGREQTELGMLGDSKTALSTVRLVLGDGDVGWGLALDDEGCITGLSNPGARAGVDFVAGRLLGARVLAVGERRVAGREEALAALEEATAAGAGSEVQLAVCSRGGGSEGEGPRLGDAPPAPLLHVERKWSESWTWAAARTNLAYRTAFTYRVVVFFPATDVDPEDAVYWVASARDETQIRAVHKECADVLLTPLLAPRMMLCEECDRPHPTFNVVGESHGRWCFACAEKAKPASEQVACVATHAVWLAGGRACPTFVQPRLTGICMCTACVLPPHN